MSRPSAEAERLRVAAAGRRVPVARVLRRGDTSPDALVETLEREDAEWILLESAETRGEIARYSFVAAGPSARLLLRDGKVVEERGGHRIDRGPSLLAALERFAVEDGLVADPMLPPLPAGAVGFLSYDAVRHFEKLPDRHPSESGLPDALFLRFDAVVAFDHARGEVLGLTTLDGRDAGALNANVQAASERLDTLEELAGRSGAGTPARVQDGEAPMRAAEEPEPFLRAVSRAKEEILAGEVYQVVLSRYWEGRPAVEPLAAYRALRALNPSPYMFYLRTREGTVFGASPEMLVRCRGGLGVVETRPIAGTVPRGATEAEDDALAERLRADPKERAEHVMLVDLARNDLGRVCRIGSITVRRYAEVERYSHVQHLVSEVRGVLAEGRTAVDALEACFPAGTLTGAPKIRAMELIDELESGRRGLYGGAVGYLDAAGQLDMAIAIRTAIVEDGVFRVQAGAGIVADSVPERELAETESKAAAVLRAIEASRLPAS